MSVSSGVAAARFRAQLLLPPGARNVEDVVDRLLAVQAQDARAFRLAVRARSHGTSARDVDTALSERRTLVVCWLVRGTLQLVRSADYWWLHTLTAPRMVAGNARRLAQLGVDESMTRRGLETVHEAVAEGPRTRDELRAALDSAGVPTAGQALVHLLVAATLHAHLVRGPVRDGDHCFVDAEQWLGRPNVPDRERCLGMLARRYLAGHGPATPADLAAYAGITLTDARHSFEMIADETRPVEGMWALGDDSDADTLPPPRLLGMFDPVLHGWVDRAFVTGAHKDVVTANGLFRATALADGRVAGTWTLPAGVVTLNPLRRLASAELTALEAEAADVLRYLDLPPAPLRVAGS
ncbi:MAG TPA: winged helix DNA-binding domain-containing protein [Nocardioidaceae bacterium]